MITTNYNLESVTLTAAPVAPDRETFDTFIRALSDLCDKVEKYARQETSRSILMNSLHAAQKLLAGE